MLLNQGGVMKKAFSQCCFCVMYGSPDGTAKVSARGLAHREELVVSLDVQEVQKYILVMIDLVGA